MHVKSTSLKIANLVDWINCVCISVCKWEMRYNYNERMGGRMDEGQWSGRGAIGPSPKLNLRLAPSKAEHWLTYIWYYD